MLLQKTASRSLTALKINGTETAEITYSPLSYCASIKANASGMNPEILMNVVSALYLYNVAANAYFPNR